MGRNFDVGQIKEYSISELKEFEDKIQEEWDKTHLVHSLTDYSEIIRELTVRKT